MLFIASLNKSGITGKQKVKMFSCIQKIFLKVPELKMKKNNSQERVLTKLGNCNFMEKLKFIQNVVKAFDCSDCSATYITKDILSDNNVQKVLSLF